MRFLFLKKWFSSVFFKGFFVVTLSLFSMHHVEASCAITFKQSDQIHENIYTYSITKWISYKYNIPFLFQPFDFSHVFSMDLYDPVITPNMLNSFDNVIELKQEVELLDFLATHDKSTLLVVSYETAIDYSTELVNDFVKPTRYKNLSFFLKYHETFKLQLRKNFVLKNPVDLIELPKEGITVAMYVQKGSLSDNEFTYVEYADQWEKIIREHNAETFFLPVKDVYSSVRFPSEQFYLEQIKQLHQLHEGKQLLVWVFTNEGDPREIIQRFKARIDLPNISFYAYSNEAEQDQHQIYFHIKALYDMSCFDCLITPESEYALLAQCLGDYKMIIYPQDVFFCFNPHLEHLFIRNMSVHVLYYDHCEQKTRTTLL